MRILRVITALAALGAVSACAQAPMASAPLPQPQPVVQSAPAPVPVMTPQVQEVSQPVVVYFDLNKAEISASTMQILYGAMPAMKAAAPKVIRVHGFTDASGKSAYNQALSLKRAEAVAGQLRKLGIVADKIEVVGQGAGPAKKGPKDQSKRRVEITWESAPNTAALPAPDQVKQAATAETGMLHAASEAPEQPLISTIGTGDTTGPSVVSVDAMAAEGIASATLWATMPPAARGPPALFAYI